MRYVLITDDSCLVSLTAKRWADGKAVEIVDINECESVIDLYDVGRLPTLLAIGDYGVIYGRLNGFNKAFYDSMYAG